MVGTVAACEETLDAVPDPTPHIAYARTGGARLDYVLALQRGGGSAIAGRAETDPELAFVLLRLAEEVIWPVTAVDGDTDPCADSFALDEVGCALLSALRDWALNSPTTAAPGIARSIIRFTVNVIPDPDHADTADSLETMRDERMVLPTPCTPLPVRTGSRTGRCASSSVRPARWSPRFSGGTAAVTAAGSRSFRVSWRGSDSPKCCCKVVGVADDWTSGVRRVRGGAAPVAGPRPLGQVCVGPGRVAALTGACLRPAGRAAG
ncbi:hypothetical protein [Streptomyces graminofaciens]|uniref:hypothetical protein n=1 Tax=Streptomyces graminofaciens TaxID=68212 RepID=UPI002573B6EB|nr:hypothetical protein [Streptomyces graminofaciens]